MIAKLYPQIEQLVRQLNLLQSEEVSMTVDIAELKTHILSELNPKQLITELTRSLLARYIHKKIVKKADGQLEVHYRTSKPSAFYVSTNIKLDILYPSSPLLLGTLEDSCQIPLIRL